MLNNAPVIALEEHYWDAEMAAQFPAGENKSHVSDLLTEIGDVRLRAMDETGIDVQVLSHGAPAAQKLPPETAVDLTRRVNDRLAEACARHPTRFAGFAALPTPVPEQAALIFEVAEKLNVPIYLHPSVPHAEVTRHYYDDYAKDFPTVIRPAWGFTVETATAAIRLILSRALEKYPKLQIILGHFGETLPFLLWRINQALSRPGQDSLSFRQQFCGNFHVTTSGNFSTPALICTMLELGIDRIMFSVDYPYVLNRDGMNWVEQLQISPDDKAKFVGGNARKLLKL